MACAMKQVRAARDIVFERLIARPHRAVAKGGKRTRRESNVVASEIGKRITGGVCTGQWCVRVLVRRKYKRPHARKSNRIPRTCAGAPIHVREADTALVQIRPEVAATPGLVNCLGSISGTVAVREELRSLVDRRQSVTFAGALSMCHSWGALVPFPVREFRGS